MSNNLMFLKCKKCGEKFCIGKYYPTEWSYHKGIEKYNEFLSKHNKCCCQTEDCINGGQIFELRYDNEEIIGE